MSTPDGAPPLSGPALSCFVLVATAWMCAPLSGDDRADVRPLPDGIVAAEPAPESDATRDRFFRLPQFRRGDTNADGIVDISDALTTFNTLFLRGEPFLCEMAADSNKDSKIDLSDGVFSLNFLFLGGRPPPSPGPSECGVDRERSSLRCDSYPACPDDFPLIAHVLNRITFGPTEDLYSRIQTRADLLDYIDEQLHPPAPYDQSSVEPALHAEIEALNTGFGEPGGAGQKLAGLNAVSLLDATESRWQLLHVVALFWNNHFHTQIDSLRQNYFQRQPVGGGASRATRELFGMADTDSSGAITEDEWGAFRELHPGVIEWDQFNRLQLDGEISLDDFLQRGQIAYWKYGTGADQYGVAADMERREYGLFRNLAFGRFRDLLEASAKSVAMVLYLNTFENTVLAPNENYAREYFELHSLGVDRVYTQRDIEELSKIFTGWTIGWVARAAYDPEDTNFQGHPEARRVPLDRREPEPFLFPTREFWDDARYTWGFLFGQQVRGGGDGHDWGRKDLFLPRYGGVDSLGNPVPPAEALSIPANDATRTVSAAMEEFALVLERTVTLRDCAKFISSKLIQLFVTDDLSQLAKTRPLPDDLRTLFDAADLDGNGTIEAAEWETPIPLVLPNGKPPVIFEDLDVDGDDRISQREYQEPDLLLDAIAVWQATGGDMRAVIRTILLSDEFLSLKFYRAKVKTPLESVTSALRALDATMTANQIRAVTGDLAFAGMELYRFADPTGESELGFDWMHTVGLLERLKLLNRGVDPVSNRERRFQWNPASFATRWNLELAEEALAFFRLLLHNDDLLPEHAELALEATASDPSDLRALVAYLISLPQYQKQ